MRLPLHPGLRLKKEEMRLASEEKRTTESNQTKVMVAMDAGDAKESSAEIAGQHAITKQAVANQAKNSPNKN